MAIGITILVYPLAAADQPSEFRRPSILYNMI